MRAAILDSYRQPVSPIRTHALTGEVSESIRVARVLCIGFMMTVHVWPGADAVLDARHAAPLGAFYWVVIDFLGRAAVPLLGIVSGYLLCRGLLQKPNDGWKVIRAKARVLIVPMALWSALLLAVDATGEQVLGQNVFLPQGPLGYLNAFLAVSEPPYNVPLAFLRDIFICAVFALAVMPLVRSRPALALGLALAVNVADFAAGGVLLLRPSIMTFYILGFLMVLRPDPGRLPGPAVLFALLLADVILQLSTPADIAGAPGVFENLFHRFTVAALMWKSSVWLTRHGGGLRRALMRTEPSIFFIFCSHMIFVGAFAALANIVGVRLSAPIYVVIFALQIALIFAGGLAGHRLLQRVWPQALDVLMGSRGKRA